MGSSSGSQASEQISEFCFEAFLTQACQFGFLCWVLAVQLYEVRFQEARQIEFIQR